MKKFFKYLGVAILLSVSFFYTEKTANVVKELDDIMIKIREIAEKYKIDTVEATITEDTIIPGINGSEIDIDKSYKEMRYIGSYNEKYLKYKTVYVKNRLIDNLDKTVISANPLKKQTSLVFIVENNSKSEKVLSILKDNNIEATFMISGLWLESNNDLLYSITKENHNIGSIGYNYSYDDSSYPWLDSVIKRVSKDKMSFCIKVDELTAKTCSQYRNITIFGEIIDKNFLINTKQKLNNGSILIYKINSNLERELDLIIKYINGKGQDIVSLKKILFE